MRLLLTLTLILAPLAGAATLTERLAELNNDADVLEAWLVADSTQVSGTNTLSRAKLAYIEIDGESAQLYEVMLWVYNAGEVTEAAYWAGQTPSVLVDPVEQKFLTGRTVNGWATLTAAQQITAIENFCNGVYQAFNAGAGDIREFSVTPVAADIVKVSGHFDLGTTWQDQTWYIRLIDPNGSVAKDPNNDGSNYPNIEFQRVVE